MFAGASGVGVAARRSRLVATIDRARIADLVRSRCICPACSGRLEWADKKAACSACETAYPIEQGVPILLAESGPVASEQWYPGTVRFLPGRLRPVAERVRDRMPELTYKSRRSRGQIGRFVAALPAGAIVANVGSGTTDFGPRVINIDVAPMPGVDVVGLGERLPLADGSFDAAILQAVLEHVQNADDTLRELRRVLVPGGELFVEVPFIQGYHPAPADYRRFTEQGLRGVLGTHGFDVVESGVAVGPASAMAWVASEFFALLLSGRSAKAYRVARLLTRVLSAPVKYLDAWLDGHPMAYTIASGVWARAAKPTDAEPDEAQARAE